MKTSELSGAALDWAVAKCEGNEIIFDPKWGTESGSWEKYSTDWSQGGPIIERQALSVYPFFCDGTKAGWSACDPHHLQYDENGEYIDGSDFAQDGPTPLVAAMRCYVASKLGEEVEIPEGLKGSNYGLRYSHGS